MEELYTAKYPRGTIQDHFIQQATEKVTLKHKDVIEFTADKQMKESMLILKSASLH